MRRTIGITTTGILATILAGWKSGDRTLGISAGVLAATAADALWPDEPGGRGSAKTPPGKIGGPDSSPAL